LQSGELEQNQLTEDTVAGLGDEHMLVKTEPSARSKDTKPRSSGKWLAQPKTIRLSTRPRLPLNPDGTRTRSFKRISHSAPLPNYVLSLTDDIDILSERLVHDTLIGMFRRLHPEKAGWNLSLVNLAVTNMAEAGGESKTANGRDISSMFRRQESVHKEFTAYADEQETPGMESILQASVKETESPHADTTMEAEDNSWMEEEDDENERCGFCGMSVPLFAMAAHMRFHDVTE
jgi:DNA polymerase iota